MQDFLSQGKPLLEFSNSSPKQIFHQAQTYPQFFDQYLKDDDRVIKIIKSDNHVNQKIFYYQYLKLCDETEEKDAHMLIQNIRDLIFNPDFYFVFDTEDPLSDNDTDGQYRRLIFQFMELLEEKKGSFNQLLKKYSIMDKVFISMLRSLLIFYGQASSIDEPVDREAALSTFQEIFGLEVQKFGNCIKFVDSDVFVYQQSPEQVYIAFIQQNEDEESGSAEYRQSEQSSLEIEKEFQTQNLIVPADKNMNGKKKQIYAASKASSIYDFVDFTSPQYGGQKPKDSFDFDNGATSAFVNKQKTLKMSANIGQKPFQQAVEKKLATSSIGQIYSQNPQKNLDMFQPRLQQSIDMGYRIEQIKNKMIKQKIQQNESQQKQKKFELTTKPSETTLLGNDQKASLQQDYFNKFEAAEQIEIETDFMIDKQPQEKVLPIKPQMKQIKSHEQQKTKYNIHNNFNPAPSSQITHNLSGMKQTRMIPFQFTPLNRQMDTKLLSFDILKSKIRLNVTKQFSNSGILQKLPQKQRTNIIQARQRARAYRRSIQYLL